MLKKSIAVLTFLFILTMGMVPAVAASTITVNLVAEPVSMDPAQVTDVNSNRIHYNMFDTLVGWDDEGFNHAPALATDWEISDNDLEYTFYLRDDVYFHDGNKLDAEAVKFTFERILDEDHPYYDTGPFPFAGSYYGPVEEIVIIDDYTVKFVLEHSFAPFLNNLTTTVGGIVSPEAVREHGEDFSRYGVGSGPYQLENWDRGVRVTLKANDNYWGQKPSIERVRVEPVVEPLVRGVQIMTGEADIIADVDPDSIEALEQDPNVNVHQQLGPHIWYVGLNLKDPPFDDQRVRQAVNYAIDRRAIVEDILKGTGVAATQTLAPAFEAHNEEVEGYPYNVDKARELLAEAGYEDGIEVSFIVPESGSGMQSPVAMSTAIQAYLREVGITASLEIMEWGAFLNRVNPGAEGKHEMWALSWMTLTGDPDMPLTNLHSGNSIPYFNSGYYDNPYVTEQLEKARQVTDPDERNAIYRELQEIITEDAPYIFVDWAKQTAAVSSQIEGFKLHPSHMFDFSKISK